MRILLSLFLFPLTLFGFTPSPILSDHSTVLVEAEWIYFSPTSETSYYAMEVVFPGVPQFSGKRQANSFDDFFSGFRVSAVYLSCWYDRFLAASWTHLHAQHNDAISVTPPGQLILPILGAPSLFGAAPGQTALANAASDDKEFNYDALDIILGQPIFSWACLQFIGFGGIHYARLASEENFTYFFFDPTVLNTSGGFKNKFCGIGPEIGLTASAQLGCNFCLEGTAFGAILIGRPKSSVRTDRILAGVVNGSIDTSNQKAWRVVPYTNIRLALKYLLDPVFCNWGCRCLHGDIQIGYEALVYFNALSDITFISFDQIGLSFDQYRNVTMHGPFVALTFGF